MAKKILSRREFLKTSISTIASAALIPTLDRNIAQEILSSAHGIPSLGGPNVIFIFADQLRACSIGCYKNDEIDTPNIDKLASQGARFANAISTSPLSAPFRACLHTGRYPNVTGIIYNNKKLPLEEIGIGEILSANGYLTKYIGKWFLNGPTPDPTLDPGWVAPIDRQGFKKWMGFNGAHVYYNGHYYLDQDPTLRTYPPNQYEPDFQTSDAINFITANKRKKFCLFMSIGTPHPPNVGLDLPPGGDYTYPYDPNLLTLRPNVDYPDPVFSRKEYANYYGITSNYDWNIGRIMTTLDTLGITKNTILVVSSDHGDYLGSHFSTYNEFRGKMEITSESLDIPFILRYPSRVKPQVVDDVFTAVDIMPTLLGFCGLTTPSGVMGRDFSPLVKAGLTPIQPPWGTIPSNDIAYVNMLSTNWHWVGVRSLQYTLQCDWKTYQPTILYDNQNDPYQLINVVDNPSYGSIRDELHQILLAWVDYIGL